MTDSPRLNAILYGAILLSLGTLGGLLLFGKGAVEGFTLQDRGLALVCWLAAAGTAGLAAWRATKSLTLGALACTASFLFLAPIARSPLHPYVPLLLLLGLGSMLLARQLDPSEKPLANASWVLGVFGGAIFIIKPDAGLAVLIAILSVLLSTGEGGLWRSKIPLLAIPPVYAFVVLAPWLDRPWVPAYLLCFALGLSAVGLGVGPFPSGMIRLSRFLIGLGATIVTGGTLLVLNGTTFGEFWQALRPSPAGLFSLLGEQVHLRSAILPLTLLSLGFAATCAFTRGLRLSRHLERVLVILRLLQFVLLCAGLLILEWEPVHDVTFALALPLIWIWSVPLLEQKPTAAAFRLLAAYLLLLQMLQAYPSAGPQKAMSCLLFFVLVAIGLRETQIWASRTGFLPLKHAIRLGGLMGLVLLLIKVALLIRSSLG